MKIAQRIDYEQVKRLNFTLVAYDSGVPQRSTPASVSIDVININDEEPVFAAAEYDAAVVENAVAGTSVLTVTAVDKDEGRLKNICLKLTMKFGFICFTCQDFVYMDKYSLCYLY